MVTSLSEFADEYLAAHLAPPRDGTPPPTPSAPYVGNGQAGPAERLDETATWADILEPRGWTQVKSPDTATLEAWRRPGGTSPVSAKVLKDAPYVLINWSTDSGLPAGSGHRLTKLRTYAHLNFNGDESAASKALLRGDTVRLSPYVVEACRSTTPPRMEPAADEPPENPWPEYQPADYESPTAEDDMLPAEEAQAELDDRLLFHELRIQRVRRRARDILDAERRGPLPPFDAGALRDMLARSRPPAARVDGLIPWEASTLIPAQRKTGKTTLLLNLGRSFLTGEPFLGKFEVRPLDGLVALLNYEVSGDTIAQWADEAGIDQDRLFHRQPPRPPQPAG